MISYFMDLTSKYNIEFVYDDEWMKETGKALASYVVAETEEGEKHRFIIVDKEFFTILEEDTQKFVVYHELGHYVAEIEGKSTDDGNRYLEEECYADSYGLKKMGYERAVRSLLDLQYTVLFLYNSVSASEELEKRIDYIMNKCKK